ncbi:MAG TPA: DNA (cytosine-5-)-methyltransferase [Symbiobacteriaceae bacterium]|nr:DNA (cytosine-5-)-methyltransferase [Symbiobacteriaceae bacterium]
MNRDHLSTTRSVADLFKVNKAKTKRRLLRRDAPIDWELLSQVFSAAYTLHREMWPKDPLDALLMIALSNLRPSFLTTSDLDELKHRAGGDWTGVLDFSIQPEALGLSEAELGHLRTVLRLVAVRFGGLTLAPLADMNDERAIAELTKLPGIDVAFACTFLHRSFGRPVLPPTLQVRLVLTRMGVLPAGLTDVESLEHVRRIPTGVPIEDLFFGFHELVNQACDWTEPDCAHCPLTRLCDQGRQTLVQEHAPGTMTFVDLFAGAGGMSLGLTQAGFRPAVAVEVDEWACETYRVNHPDLPRSNVLCGDIRKMDPNEARTLMNAARPDMVVGGPPCQGFSLIGKRGRAESRFIDDPRNKLYKEFVRWIEHLRPRFVVMENVPGLYSYADGAVRRDIEANLNDIGFAVDELVVDASRYGVPQRRQRVIFIGVSTTDFGQGAPGIARRITALLRDRSEEEVTLLEAIADLPALDAGEGLEASFIGSSGEQSAYAREMGAGEHKVLYHHVARPINLRDKLLYARIKPGETAGDVMEQGGRHLMVYRNDMYEDKYRRLRYDEPSPTIMSHLAKDGHMFIHPDRKQRRSITVREAARIQSFPDDFLFLGPRTAQFIQVGNAVPPKLARAIGQAITQALAEVYQ